MSDERKTAADKLIEKLKLGEDSGIHAVSFDTTGVSALMGTVLAVVLIQEEAEKEKLLPEPLLNDLFKVLSFGTGMVSRIVSQLGSDEFESVIKSSAVVASSLRHMITAATATRVIGDLASRLSDANSIVMGSAMTEMHIRMEERVGADWVTQKIGEMVRAEEELREAAK